FALHRLVHLGGVLPGDHARAHRSFHSGSGRSPARTQGERHRRPPHPCRHWHGVLPQRAPLARDGRGCGQGTGGSLGGIRRGRARSRDDAPRGRNRGTGGGVSRTTINLGGEPVRPRTPFWLLSSDARKPKAIAIRGTWPASLVATRTCRP